MVYTHSVSEKAISDQLNQLGQEKRPFLFIIDFDRHHFYIAPLDQLNDQIFFSIAGFSNQPLLKTTPNSPLRLKKNQFLLLVITPLLTASSKK